VFMKFPGRGVSVRDNEIEFDIRKAEAEVNVPDDVLAAELLCSLANSLYGEDDIQIIFDTPSRNETGMMPVLDLQLWVQEDQVNFLFYEKPMTTNFVLHKLSALSCFTKKVTLAGEISRRYFNTRPCLVETGIMDEIVDKFRNKMMVSGYTFKERELIVKEGRNRYNNVLAQVKDGDRPMYRSAAWKKEERAVERKKKGKTWHGKQFESVIFVQSSPGELLKRGFRKL